MLEKVICSEFGTSLDDGFDGEYPEMKKSKKSNNGVSAGTVLFIKTSGGKKERKKEKKENLFTHST